MRADILTFVNYPKLVQSHVAALGHHRNGCRRDRFGAACPSHYHDTPRGGHTKEPATRQDMSNVHMFLNALARAWRPAQYASHEVGGRVVRSPNAVTLVSTRLPSRRVKPHISQVGSPSLGTTPHTRR